MKKDKKGIINLSIFPFWTMCMASLLKEIHPEFDSNHIYVLCTLEMNDCTGNLLYSFKDPDFSVSGTDMGIELINALHHLSKLNGGDSFELVAEYKNKKNIIETQKVKKIFKLPNDIFDFGDPINSDDLFRYKTQRKETSTTNKTFSAELIEAIEELQIDAKDKSDMKLLAKLIEDPVEFHSASRLMGAARLESLADKIDKVKFL